MPYHYTANLEADIQAEADDEERFLASRPTCDFCFQPIVEDQCYVFDDDFAEFGADLVGKRMCQDCHDSLIKLKFVG